MRIRLIVSLLLGIATAAALYYWMEGYKATQVAVSLLKLKNGVSMARGEKIEPQMIETISIPAKFASMMQTALPATDRSQEWLMRQSAARDIVSGSILLYQDFSEEEGQRLAPLIPIGKRAVTFPIGVSEAVANFVEPGSIVDILGTVTELPPRGTGSEPATEGRVVTKTFMQRVKVLAVGRATSPGSFVRLGDRGYNTITFEVTPAEAELLVFAMEQARGRMTLVLRNPNDDAIEKLPVVDGRKL